MRSKYIIGGAFLGWLVVAIGGMAVLEQYARTPGAGPGNLSPSQIGPPAPAGKLRLVMFLHPLCPCSRASVEELAVLLASDYGRIVPEVVFIQPKGVPEKWGDTDLRRQVESLAGVAVKDDPDGRLAAQWEARTSGDTVVFDDRGAVVYRGGLTGARGHMGDNEGLAAVQALAAGSKIAGKTGPVFGCALVAGRSDARGGQP